jgi:hypothetical protein
MVDKSVILSREACPEPSRRNGEGSREESRGRLRMTLVRSRDFRQFRDFFFDVREKIPTLRETFPNSTKRSLTSRFFLRRSGKNPDASRNFPELDEKIVNFAIFS